jgi:hypothetical protein
MGVSEVAFAIVRVTNIGALGAMWKILWKGCGEIGGYEVQCGLGHIVK